MFYFNFFLVFLSMGIADVCWTKYIQYVHDEKELPAALWSVAILLCSIISVVSYTHDKRLIWGALLGAFIGTYFTIRHKRKNNGSKKN